MNCFRGFISRDDGTSILEFNYCFRAVCLFLAFSRSNGTMGVCVFRKRIPDSWRRMGLFSGKCVCVSSSTCICEVAASVAVT